MGTIYQDRNTAVAGELGKRPAWSRSPSTSRAAANPSRPTRCRWSTIRCSRRCCCRWPSSAPSTPPSAPSAPPAFGSPARSSFRTRPPPSASTTCSPPITARAMQASLSAAIPVAYVMQSGFDSLQLKQGRAQYRVLRPEEAAHHRRHHRLAPAKSTPAKRCSSTSRSPAITARKSRATWITRCPSAPSPARSTSPWPTPTPPISPTSARSSPPRRARPRQLIATVNNLHPNTKAYVRVWRADPAFQLEGADLPDPPASVALILAGSQSSAAGITQTRNAKIAEMEIDARRYGRLRHQNRSGGNKGMIVSTRHSSAPAAVACAAASWRCWPRMPPPAAPPPGK